MNSDSSGLENFLFKLLLCNQDVHETEVSLKSAFPKRTLGTRKTFPRQTWERERKREELNYILDVICLTLRMVEKPSQWLKNGY